MSTAQNNEVISYLEKLAGSSLAASLGAMLGQTVEADRLSDPLEIKAGMWLRQEFSPAAFGSVSFQLEKTVGTGLGHRLLAASGLEGEDDETALGTLGEVMAQVGGALASALSGKFKQEVAAKPLNNNAPPATPYILGFQITLGANDSAFINICPDEDLVKVLTPAAVQTAPAALVPTASSAAPSHSTSVNTRNLDLLLDVEMPVSVSFGRTQLPLKDVIKLTTGSIVELNRAVSEPVDIIVNNCVIAKGEVVVVEGNFGVRIKQIMSKQERLQSLS